MLSNFKVQIIDDEEDLCFLLSKALQKSTAHVISSHTLEQGIEDFQNFKPDWLILDNNLPDGLGWENASKFFELSPAIKIIYISANPDSIVKYGLSESSCFTKPLNFSAILNAITKEG